MNVPLLCMVEVDLEVAALQVLAVHLVLNDQEQLLQPAAHRREEGQEGER